MNCMNCGVALPNSAKFCYGCGAAVGTPGAQVQAPAPPASPTGPTVAPAGVQELKCPGCGAPIKPVFGEMVITCDYCGGCVTLGGTGWKEINKHTMLPLKVMDSAAALAVVQGYLDTGFLHRKAFEESKLEEAKLSYVPYWVLPTSATTSYTYQDMVVGVGSTVGTIAAAAVIGGALGGRRGGGFYPLPIMMGPPVNPTRQDTISGTYEYPVIAVKSMVSYQPKDYQFALGERSLFDRKQVPSQSPVLNGDLGEDAAQHSARSYVTQLQTEEAHKRHHMVSQLSCQVEVSEGELLHVPVWYFQLDRNGQKTIVLVDGHSGRVIHTVQ